MKRFLAIGVVAVLLFGLMTGCTKTEDTASNGKKSGGKLQVEVTLTDQNLSDFKAICDDFTKESGIEIDLVAPGTDYETVMKTRMSSGDLPDVWETHGWSVARYSEYLRPLNDQSWFDRIDTSTLGVISDEDNNIYVLPISQAVSGVIYNVDVLKEAGVDPLNIHCLDDFEAACEKIKGIGKIPIYIGGKESGNAAGFFGSIAPCMLTDEGCAYPNGKELKDGTFDWDKYGTLVIEKIAEYVNKGYVNTDFTTADSKVMQTALGEGKCGFVFRNTPNIVNARNYVPGCNVSIMPIPSSSENGKACFKIGEQTCFGIWKDTKKLEEATKFLDYLSQVEEAKKICKILGSIPALTDVNIDDDYAVGQFKKAQIDYKDYCSYDNIFDREYFPSGMWGVMGDAVTETVMHPDADGIKSAVAMLKENYIDKYAEAHAKK